MLENGMLLYKEKEEEVVCNCYWCGKHLFFGDIVYNFDGNNVCEDCVWECRGEL